MTKRSSPQSSPQLGHRSNPMADREKRAAQTRSGVSRLGDEDRQLSDLIRKTLIEDPVLWSDDIAIRVKQGRVILEGVVESHAQRERAESVLSVLLGVKAVSYTHLRAH